MSRATKESGIDWIGKIPEHWEINRLGEYFVERREKVNDRDFPPLSVTKQGILPQLDTVAKSGDNENRKKVVSGDFVINSRSDRKQSCGLSSYTGSVSLINTVVTPRNIHHNYIGYLLNNYGFAEEFFRWGHGIVMDLWTTNWKEMSNIPLPIPTIREQIFIAIMLDKRIPQIDRLIHIQVNQIGKLKEYKQTIISRIVTQGLNDIALTKESKIEFIGKISKDWEVKPLKYLFDIKRGSLDKNVSLNEIPVKLVQYTSIYNNVELDSTDQLLPITATEKEISDAQVKFGDLLMTASSETADDIGHTSLISIKDQDLVFGSDIIRLRNDEIYHDFKKYLLENKFHLDTLTSYCRGITRYRFSMDDFRNHKWLIPPLEFQIEASRILNNLSSKVNRLIEIKQGKINLLQDYKKSIIYEYVTGKKEV